MTTTSHRMTDLQTRALAAFIHDDPDRHDWDPPGVVAALRASRDHHDAWTLAIAALRAAADPTNRTPAVLRFDDNRCWTDEPPACTIHGRAPRRSDTGECANCWANQHEAGPLQPKPATPPPAPLRQLVAAGRPPAKTGQPQPEQPATPAAATPTVGGPDASR